MSSLTQSSNLDTTIPNKKNRSERVISYSCLGYSGSDRIEGYSRSQSALLRKKTSQHQITDTEMDTTVNSSSDTSQAPTKQQRSYSYEAETNRIRQKSNGTQYYNR